MSAATTSLRRLGGTQLEGELMQQMDARIGWPGAKPDPASPTPRAARGANLFGPSVLSRSVRARCPALTGSGKVSLAKY